ncbi:MAG: hypothetical protein SFV23_15490 [Planctomycetaceae bacterium]|nr:hypothetical protein [Planctomycetaceae bacterium]
MLTQVKFHCQNCGCPIVADGAAAGTSFQCFRCPEMVTIPSTTALARIDDGPPLTAYPDANVNGVVVASSHDARSSPHGVTPVELRLPGQLGGLKANVDQGTSNSIASAFLGGALVALGAALTVMLGGKHRT